MKKLMAIVLVLVMALSICACGSKSNDAGKYIFSSMESEGQVYNAEDLSALGLDGGSMYIELRTDGTAVISLLGETMEGTWKPGSITIDGDTEEYTIDGKMLTLANEGEKISFEKE